MTSIPQDFKIKKKDNFLLLFPLEIVSHYPDSDISHTLSVDVKWIMLKVFRVKLMV